MWIYAMKKTDDFFCYCSQIKCAEKSGARAPRTNPNEKIHCSADAIYSFGWIARKLHIFLFLWRSNKWSENFDSIVFIRTYTNQRSSAFYHLPYNVVRQNVSENSRHLSFLWQQTHGFNQNIGVIPFPVDRQRTCVEQQYGDKTTNDWLDSERTKCVLALMLFFHWITTGPHRTMRT